ncbi:MAG: response regulator transcription factor [Anaerolineaceae bacterium]|nr:response regulator transcription factor [Anaerolineaceae bacterium]
MIGGKKILVIDDDVFVREIVTETMHREGAQVFTAENGPEGLRQFYACQPDLVLLDVMMPHVSGWEIGRQIRQLSDVPIIMLTSLAKEEDIIRGLDYGAVDYVTKPFSPKVLAARIRAALRQSSLESAGKEEKAAAFQDGHLTIDLNSHLVTVNNTPLKLTKTEYRVLAYLVQNAGLVLTFQQILEHVWGWDYQDSIQYVHVYVSRLRQKIEPEPQNPQYLLTEYGTGYRFKKTV